MKPDTPPGARLLRFDLVRRRLGLPKLPQWRAIENLIAYNEDAQIFKWMLGIRAENLIAETRELLPEIANPHFDAAPFAAFAGTGIAPVVYGEHMRKSLEVHEYRDVYVVSLGTAFAIFRDEAIDPNSLGIVVNMKRMQRGPIEEVAFGALCDDHFKPTNPCHFIVDRLPRGHLFRTLMNVAERDLVFVHAGAPFATYAKDRVFPQARTLMPETVYKFARLLVLSTSFRPRGHPFFYLDEGAVAAILPKVLAGVPERPTSGRRIYLARRDAHRRPMLNEADLIAALDQRGFTSYDMGTLAPADQLAAVRSAEVVVAPHGAALTNVIATHPSAQVIELFNPEQGTAAYAALCSLVGARYTPVFGTRCAGTVDESWRLDIPALTAML